MILDKDTMWANGLAHGGTVTEIDLQTVRPGPGEPIRCFVHGVGLVGATGIAITDGAATGSLASLMTLPMTAAEMNAGPIEFMLPAECKRYVEVNLTGTTSAGTWSAGIVLAGVQTNR